MVRWCWVNFQCRGVLQFGYSRARAYCACSRCGWGFLDIFTLIYPVSPLSPSLLETARYRLKYCLKGPLNPNQPTNQPTLSAQPDYNYVKELEKIIARTRCFMHQSFLRPNYIFNNDAYFLEFRAQKFPLIFLM